MNKQTKIFLWFIAVLVAVAVGLTVYSCITGNFDVGGYFIMGFFITAFALVLLFGVIDYIEGLIKLHGKKKLVQQEKVYRKRPLPVYYKYVTVIWVCICIIVAIVSGVMIINGVFRMNDKSFIMYVFAVLFGGLVISIVYYLKTRQQKMLFLVKDYDKVKNYNDNVERKVEIVYLQRCLASNDWFIKNKCEKIELNSNVEMWSCFSYCDLTRPGDDYGSSRSYYSYIFAVVKWNEESDFDIELNNIPSEYLNKDNQYISKFSNLPPFLFSGDKAEEICEKIEEICSNFFAKTRSKYVLAIRAGTIGLGLKNARFGRLNRIFNKQKTIDQTKEAIEEIEQFLLQIKEIVKKIKS